MRCTWVCTGWIFDSVSCNMTSNLSILTNCYHISFLVITQTASGTSSKVNKIGINTPQLSSDLLCIPSALQVPKLSLNSLSISQLTTSGYKVSFNNTPCFVQDPRTDIPKSRMRQDVDREVLLLGKAAFAHLLRRCCICFFFTISLLC